MPSIEEQIRNALSSKRIETYENLKDVVRPDLTPLPLDKALALYAWNAQVSAAFMHPLHICEVVVRNGVASVIEEVYGERWPWSPGFFQSLPHPATGYSMQHDLVVSHHESN